MNGRERVTRMIAGEPVDRLPLMPITMMFAGDQLGVPYGRYARDHRVMVDAQLLVAERFGFDYVSGISDPARETIVQQVIDGTADHPASRIRPSDGTVTWLLGT